MVLNSYEISRQVSKSKQWPQILAALSAMISSIGVGLHLSWLSPAQPKLLNGGMPFNITKEETSYMAMIQPLGYLIGCPLGAYFANRIGRKPSLLIVAIPQIITWIMIAQATLIETIYFAKLIAGIGEGAFFLLLPMYVGEICEPCVRGGLSATIQLGGIIGMLLMNAYGSYTSLQVSAYISIIVPVLFFLTFIWMPESPYYYLIKGKSEKAKESLQYLRRMDNVDEELKQLTADVRRQMSESKSFKDIFLIESNRKALLVMILLRFFQQFTGLFAIFLYTQTIFQAVGGNLSPAVSAMILSTCQMAICSLVSFITDKCGRRPLFIISSVGVFICLIMEGAYFYAQSQGIDVSNIAWLATVGLLAYTMINNLGIGVCPVIMTGEIFSASIKSKALIIMNLCFALFFSANAKIFQLFEVNFGMHAPFFFYAIICLLAIVFGITYLPETKGKTLEEIQQELKGNKKQEDFVLKQ